MQHKEVLGLKLFMHSYVNLLAFVKLKMIFCCLSNASLFMRDWRLFFHEIESLIFCPNMK